MECGLIVNMEVFFDDSPNSGLDALPSGRTVFLEYDDLLVEGDFLNPRQGKQISYQPIICDRDFKPAPILAGRFGELCFQIKHADIRSGADGV